MTLLLRSKQLPQYRHMTTLVIAAEQFGNISREGPFYLWCEIADGSIISIS